MTRIVDGRNSIWVSWVHDGNTHINGYDSRTRAAEDLLYENQIALGGVEAIASMESTMAFLASMISQRRQWIVQQTCPHDWVEVGEGKQCVRPGCELFVKNDEA